MPSSLGVWHCSPHCPQYPLSAICGQDCLGSSCSGSQVHLLLSVALALDTDPHWDRPNSLYSSLLLSQYGFPPISSLSCCTDLFCDASLNTLLLSLGRRLLRTAWPHGSPHSTPSLSLHLECSSLQVLSILDNLEELGEPPTSGLTQASQQPQSTVASISTLCRRWINVNTSGAYLLGQQ